MKDIAFSSLGELAMKAQAKFRPGQMVRVSANAPAIKRLKTHRKTHREKEFVAIYPFRITLVGETLLCLRNTGITESIFVKKEDAHFW